MEEECRFEGQKTQSQDDYLACDGKAGCGVPPAENGVGELCTYGGRFLRYDLRGHTFNVTAKYMPPINLINGGAFGLVCSAWNGETKEEVAIKKICNAFDNMIVAKRTLREIKILKHMHHENVLALKEVIPPPTREKFTDVYIVTELMATDLHNIIKDNTDATEDHYRFFLYQLLRGLKYIHSAKILHRDIKPSNLFIDEDCLLKIGDFGLARAFSETDLMTEYVVTRYYRSPELLLNPRGYTTAVDMWSVGCVLMELYNKVPLFRGRDYLHQFRCITELMGSPTDADLAIVRSKNAVRYLKQLPKYPKQPLAEKFPHVPRDAVDLVEKILTFDPVKRITAEEALDHPYLSALHSIADEPTCPTHFNFEIDEQSLTEEDIRELIYQEAVMYYNHPHSRSRDNSEGSTSTL